MLSPLLFNVFFAAVVHAVMVLFSEDVDILTDLVHLEEDRVRGTDEPPLEHVRRAVWNHIVRQ